MYEVNIVPLIYIKRSFYQDRLGTNIGKTLKYIVPVGYCELHNNRPKTAETSAIRVS